MNVTGVSTTEVLGWRERYARDAKDTAKECGVAAERLVNSKRQLLQRDRDDLVMLLRRAEKLLMEARHAI